jgi:ABC-type transport system substrate-binding protein
VDLDKPLGTGPYYLSSNGAAASLHRRTNWWCNAINMQITAPTIALTRAESVTQIRDEFEFSDLSLVCADPNSDRYADYRCDYELWDCENGMFMYLTFNKDSTTFSDPQIRAAITYAIDRETLALDYYRGFARPANLPASSQFPYYSQALASRYAYDPVKFKQIISDAGLTGKGIILLVNKDDSLRLRAAKAIAAMLEEGGLVVELSALNGETYQEAMTYRVYDLYLGQTRLSPNMDLSAFFHTNGALSYGGVNDVAAYSLCLQALENHGNYYTLYQTVMDNGLMCPVLSGSYAVYATRGLLTQLTPARDNIFYYTLGKSLTQAQMADTSQSDTTS